MVARLHDAGLEVILDVVYNHTAEGNERGPTLSFRGIDNASYYRLLPDQATLLHQRHRHRQHAEPVASPRASDGHGLACAIGSTEMHVDGFRFDLGTILAREPIGFDQRIGFLNACLQDPVLARVKLIAEPWDIGPGGYQVGGFPPGWAEWNDKFRDTVRGFWKGDDGKLPEMATRLAASADAFDRRGRKPWASINFITAHDGFTLHDLVSYNEKHNEANGEDNRDGHPITIVLEPRRGGTDRRSGDQRRCATGRCATCWRRCCCRRARRCCWRATSSAAPSMATTTPIARTTRSAGSIGTSTRTAGSLIDFVRR